MGNAVQYDCERKEGGCTYWQAIHGVEGYDYHEEKYKKCCHCTKRTAIDYREFIEKRGK